MATDGGGVAFGFLTTARFLLLPDFAGWLAVAFLADFFEPPELFADEDFVLLFALPFEPLLFAVVLLLAFELPFELPSLVLSFALLPFALSFPLLPFALLPFALSFALLPFALSFALSFALLPFTLEAVFAF